MISCWWFWTSSTSSYRMDTVRTFRKSILGDDQLDFVIYSSVAPLVVCLPYDYCGNLIETLFQVCDSVMKNWSANNSPSAITTKLMVFFYVIKWVSYVIEDIPVVECKPTQETFHVPCGSSGRRDEIIPSFHHRYSGWVIVHSTVRRFGFFANSNAPVIS